MRLNPKVGGAAAAAAAFVIAMPAAAHPGNSGHHGRTDHSNKSGHHGHGKNSNGAGNSSSKKCTPHNVAYVESGTIDSGTASSLAANQDGTWSGTLVVDVLHANHRAKA